jgi:hypothetical protein
MSSRDALHERLGGLHRGFSEHVYGAPSELAQQVLQRVAGGRRLRRLQAETVRVAGGVRDAESLTSRESGGGSGGQLL